MNKLPFPNHPPLVRSKQKIETEREEINRLLKVIADKVNSGVLIGPLIIRGLNYVIDDLVMIELDQHTKVD